MSHLKFVLLSTARSGTTFVYTALNNHPDCFMHGEVFHPNQKQIKPELLELIDVNIRDSDPIKFVELLFSHNFGKPVVGCQIWQPQSPQAVEYLILNKEIKKIYLQRQNILAKYASKQLAQQTKIWNINSKKAQNKSIEFEKLNFDLQNFLKFYQIHKQIDEYYQKYLLSQDYLHLDYQKNVMTGDLDILYDFLNLSRDFPLQGQTKKLYNSKIINRFQDSEHDKIIVCLKEINKMNWISE